MANKPVTKPEDLRIYRGLTLSADSLPTPEEQRKHLDRIPPPPPWRSFSLSPEAWTKAAKSQEIPPEQGKIDPRALGFVADKKAVELVNAALCLRRPLLIEGNPGAGKTSLAYAVARELGLPGPRLQEASLQRQKVGEGGEYEEPDIGSYLRLGPMGMAFYRSRPGRPAVLLIDEIDKSDIDMPNDLLHIFEEGFFEIPELTRLKTGDQSVLPYRGQQDDSEEKIPIDRGCVSCQEFPLVFMTSNEAREFPPAFLRRCLRLRLEQPDNEDDFYRILEQRFPPERLNQLDEPARNLIRKFLDRIKRKDKLATDQLLNAVYLLLQGNDLTATDRQSLLDTIFKSLQG